MVATRDTAARVLDTVITGLASFVAAYGIFKASGLFGPPASGFVRAVHEPAAQAALWLIMAAAAPRMLLRRGAGNRPPGPFFQAGILLMAAGLVASSFVRFEGAVSLTEGQQFTGSPEDYVEGSLYRGKRAGFPNYRLGALEVVPTLSGDESKALSIHVRATYGDAERPPREIRIGSMLPSYVGGMFLRIKRFGYSPLFQFTDDAGMIIKEFYWRLNLFPPGREDSLRSLWIPHVFYLQYFPDGIREDRRGTRDPANEPGPAFRLRIVRNLDLLYQEEVRVHQRVAYDGMGVSFEEVRKWAEISVVRDPGMLLVSAGCLVAAVSLLARFLLPEENPSFSGETGGDASS